LFPITPYDEVVEEFTYTIRQLHNDAFATPVCRTKESRDRKDNKFLVCASEAQADYLITSDEDLLALKTYEKTRIIPPQEFVALLESSAI
jgi:predicted nucleic acid-binding protein